MHRRLRVAGTIVLACGLAGCAALGPGRTSDPSAAPAVTSALGSDGVARVRFDHRTGSTDATPTVAVPRGRTVELVVASDTAERVLVSGIDQVRYVTAGGTVTVRFVAAAPGTTTVTLGRSGTVLGRVETD